MNITYNKGIFTFQDETKNYTYNINTNEIHNAKTSKQVKGIGFTNAEVKDALSLLTRNDKTWCDSIFGILERSLDGMSLRYMAENRPNVMKNYDKLVNMLKGYGKTLYQHTAYWHINDLQDKDFKYISKVIKDVQDTVIDVVKILQLYRLQKQADKYGIPVDFYSKHQWTIESYIVKTHNPEIAMWYFYNQKLYILDMYDDIRRYMRECLVMRKQPIKATNVLREFIETHQAYELWKKLDTDTRFSQIYDVYKDKLAFEYGDFEIVLPTCPQDLITEGNQMHHCVGGYVERVARGETLIVFVRNKNNLNAPYITCHGELNGEINQCYLLYDRNISKEQDVAFQRAYAKHLEKVWNS